jgi:hypothetical protein
MTPIRMNCTLPCSRKGSSRLAIIGSSSLTG